MKKFLRDNGLSVVLLVLFLFSVIGQAVTGWHVFNKQRAQHHKSVESFGEYFGNSDFYSALFENWESEYLQMALLVVLTALLQQKGAAESKDLDKEHESDREPNPNNPGAPAIVQRGGIGLQFYKVSLSIVLTALFFLSFALHAFFSWEHTNEEALDHGMTQHSFISHLGNSQFWFESFQNWQSEFLAILSLSLLSIWLRQQGSPQSKPVDAPHGQTGAEE